MVERAYKNPLEPLQLTGTPVENKQPIHISVPEGKEPLFCNATQVTVQDDAVLVQCAYVRPHAKSGKLISEIILSPKHAIHFSRALDAAIKKHFTRHLDKEAEAKDE